METRAPFIIVGAFILAAAGAIFGFVYWLHNTGGLTQRTSYSLQFNGSVPGLLVGASVLFNGIRVGEVTGLSLAANKPRQVNAVIAVARDTPIRSDTKVSLDFQGLTGVPVVALEGGNEVTSAPVSALVAEPGAGQSMTQAARDALRRVDTVLADNAEPLQSTIANLKTFSEGLARNTGKLDNIVAGLERMTGGGGQPATKTIYDLSVPEHPVGSPRTIKGQLTIPDPTSILLFDTQRVLLTPPGGDHVEFANVQWSDTIPKLIQAKLLQNFEDCNIDPPPLRAIEGVNADYQLLLDVRAFEIDMGSVPIVDIGLSAKILNKEGRIVASRPFRERKKLDGFDAKSAVATFSAAFDVVAKRIVDWTANSLE